MFCLFTFIGYGTTAEGWKVLSNAKDIKVSTLAHMINDPNFTHSPHLWASIATVYEEDQLG